VTEITDERTKERAAEASCYAGDAVLDAFARLHPSVTMSWLEWCDLREMIDREYMGWGNGAEDLQADPAYLLHRRTALPPRGKE